MDADELQITCTSWIFLSQLFCLEGYRLGDDFKTIRNIFFNKFITNFVAKCDELSAL